MITTHSVEMDLVRNIGKYIPPIDVMQDDKYSRDIQFTVKANGSDLILSGHTALIRFKKADGTGGNYDTLPDGSPAYSIEGNILTASLAPQVLTAVGKVELSVAIIGDNGKSYLHTFAVALNVHRTPGLEAASENYIKILGMLPDTGWPANKYLGTDDSGNVVARDETGDIVSYKQQTLNDDQKAQARENIGAASIDPIEDRANTKVTLTVTAGQLLDIRAIYRQDNHGGVTRIDWGDGSKTAIVGATDDEMKHTYTKAGTYTITMTGLTHIAASVFNEKNVSAVEIGSIVQFMGQLAFNCIGLTEARIYAETPPEITLTSGGLGPFGNLHTTIALIVPENSLSAYMRAAKWDIYKDVLTTEDTRTTVTKDKVVTVGAGGDFATINDALAYLSRYYPRYKASGIKCEIQILAGTIITEQIFVERTDLSYITITSAASDNKVQVAPSAAWTGLSHDTRGNKPFISGENGARLPCIKCLFSCIVPEGGWVATGATEDINCAVGYFCNRGSTGVISGYANSAGVLDNIGFENFYDNIIANNNSEIVLREAYARGAARYGVMSRHISRVSARSANITNCGDTAAYADRASMLDVRHADLTGSNNGIAAYHASTITANETVASSIPGTVADAKYGSAINCQAITAAGSKDAFKVTGGATIVATNAKVTNETGTKYSQDTNTLTANGVIYA